MRCLPGPPTREKGERTGQTVSTSQTARLGSWASRLTNPVTLGSWISGPHMWNRWSCFLSPVRGLGAVVDTQGRRQLSYRIHDTENCTHFLPAISGSSPALFSSEPCPSLESCFADISLLWNMSPAGAGFVYSIHCYVPKTSSSSQETFNKQLLKEWRDSTAGV